MKVMTMCTIRALQFVVGMLICQVAWSDELIGILMVEIAGLKDVQGDVYLAVYDSDAAWLGKKTVMGKKVSIADARDGDLVRTEIKLPPGEYALSVFYDEDGDGKLSTNFIGIPKEPIAMSNNAMGKFGPPSYEDAVFTLAAEPIIQHITIKQL